MGRDGKSGGGGGGVSGRSGESVQRGEARRGEAGGDARERQTLTVRLAEVPCMFGRGRPQCDTPQGESRHAHLPLPKAPRRACGLSGR